LDGIETGASISKLKGIVSHREQETAELIVDREFAVEYLKAPMKSLNNRDGSALGLLAFRR